MEAAALAMKPVVKVAALCGSLRKASMNGGLIRSGKPPSTRFPPPSIQLCDESIEGMTIEYVDIAPLPFVNTDLEVNGTFPESVEAFRQTIRGADAILFASPETGENDWTDL
ncbi:hypothetical protein GW17_00020530 [Ensete ventricosum]|nr:hypothetical protein GW17_00020530 [Ensete ventricosum]RZS09375.1 hypothetical protein BHM03_00040487 [Ensete ventricosum]